MPSIARTTKRTGVVAALVVAGIAYAAWTSNGTDNGTVTAGTSQGLTVEADDSVGGLHPSGSKNTTVTVTNPNPYEVTMDSLTATVVGSDQVGCTTANSFVTVDAQTVNEVLAQDTGSHVYTFAVNMGANAADACQGAAFDIEFQAQAHSS